MPEQEKAYTDIDYDSFPPADLDLHWIRLPTAVIRQRTKAKQEAEEQARLATPPPDHKIILVPTDPTYSPTEEKLWPLIHDTVQSHLRPHPELRATINAAIGQSLAEHLGWRNPFHVPSPPSAPPRVQK